MFELHIKAIDAANSRFFLMLGIYLIVECKEGFEKCDTDGVKKWREKKFLISARNKQKASK